MSQSSTLTEAEVHRKKFSFPSIIFWGAVVSAGFFAC